MNEKLIEYIYYIGL